MIKSLLEFDEPEKIDKNDAKTVSEPSTVDKDKSSEESTSEAVASKIENGAPNESDGPVGSVKPFEIPRPIGRPVSSDLEIPELEMEKKIAEIEDLISDEHTPAKPDSEVFAETPMTESKVVEPTSGDPVHVAGPEVKVVAAQENALSSFNPYADKDAEMESDTQVVIQAKDFVPEQESEVMRKSGMAYSAAIALFGSVVFMLIMGWFADLLLGIKPWGTVIGIVIGAIIGFIQFFRITSQITHPKPNDFERVSFRSNEMSSPKVQEAVEDNTTISRHTTPVEESDIEKK